MNKTMTIEVPLYTQNIVLHCIDQYLHIKIQRVDNCKINNKELGRLIEMLILAKKFLDEDS